MQVSTFYEKLNKVDGNIYVVEEEIHFTNGVYEAELQHDNINEATFAVFTGPKLTGTRLETYTLSTPSLAPWKRIVRVYADVPVAYISYETDGDTVEGDDINRVQATVVETQKALNTEEARALSAEMELNGRIDTEVKRAEDAELTLRNNLASEITRAKAAEKSIGDAVNTHISNKSNPHGVTKSQVGLGSVPNVATNDQVPTFTQATTLDNLTSGEKLTVMLGKLRRQSRILSLTRQMRSNTSRQRNGPTGMMPIARSTPTATRAFLIRLPRLCWISLQGLRREQISMYIPPHQEISISRPAVLVDRY